MHQRSRKGIAGSHCVHHFYSNRRLLMRTSVAYQETASRAASDADQYQLEPCNEFLCGRALVRMRLSKQFHDFWHFLIIQLHNVGNLHRLTEDVRKIKRGAQIDVENADGVFACLSQETSNRLSTDCRALG